MEQNIQVKCETVAVLWFGIAVQEPFKRGGGECVEVSCVTSSGSAGIFMSNHDPMHAIPCMVVACGLSAGRVLLVHVRNVSCVRSSTCLVPLHSVGPCTLRQASTSPSVTLPPIAHRPDCRAEVPFDVHLVVPSILSSGALLRRRRQRRRYGPFFACRRLH